MDMSCINSHESIEIECDDWMATGDIEKRYTKDSREWVGRIYKKRTYGKVEKNGGVLS